ncbi:hypothetical protein A3860_39200 [Niastella vici]|uniref:Uncharacterized protein n=1 Tax=Niastella vici TaxID=1703345 RepID=A0A1V9FKF7_9BACT|nr:hypothetical protein [Niastella vici]OQP58838.1 hypothetical protein A3860_39200 [Niastella vici]
MKSFFKQFLLKISSTKHDTQKLEKCPNSVYCDYQTICLQQPHLKIRGIWKLDGNYFIVCPGLRKESLTMDGELFSEWFQKNKILTSPTLISAYIPKRATQVRPLNQIEIADLAGSPRNLTFFYYDLLLNLPKLFPKFKLQDQNGLVTVITEKELSNTEIEQFKEVLTKLNERINIEFQVNASLEKFEQRLIEQPILLKPSKTIFSRHPELRRICEEDEDFWMSQKYQLLQSNPNSKDFMKDGWLNATSSCLVSEYAHPSDIRNYLTLYNTVFLRMPILEHHNSYMKSLGCTMDELLKLCHIGRIKLVLDQPLDRYSPEVWSALTMLNCNQFILSRRLAAVVVTDLRHRMPLLYPPFDIETKYELLHGLYTFLKNKPETQEVTSLIKILCLVWGDYFESIQRLGSHGLNQSGVFHILNYMFSKHNKDYGVEIMDTSPSVSYAAAFGANLISRNMYNDAPLAELIANMYSGIPKDFVPGNQLFSNTAVEEIMVISKDVPLTEFASSFHSGDIDRFRKMIYDLTKHIKNENELPELVQRFNNEVKAYAYYKDAKEAFDIRGFLIDSSTAVAQTSIPLAAYFIGRLVAVLNRIGARNKSIRQMLDYLDSIAASTVPDAVLVARMRRQLTENWSKSRFGYD